MQETIKQLILGSSLMAILAQFAVLLIASLLQIYAILIARRETVVVLSHPRIVVGTVFASAVSLPVFQAILLWNPMGNWVIAALLLVAFVWKIVLYMLTRPLIDGSLKDTTKETRSAFNCNWPLIPRLVHNSLIILLICAYGVREAKW